MTFRQQVEKALRSREFRRPRRLLPVAADHETHPGARHRDVEQAHRLGVAGAPAVAIGCEIAERGRAEEPELAPVTSDAVENVGGAAGSLGPFPRLLRWICAR